MMHQTESLPYAAGDGYQAVELAYDGLELAMTLIVPERGRFEEFEETLDAARIDEILAELGHELVALSLPRFEFESQFNLKDALSALGMPNAFTGAADFSGMTGGRDLFISEVVHKAFVAVDEAGTEAAAATAVLMPAGARIQEPVEVTVDRPFVLLIRDIETGAILFVGRVVDPGTG
jgi:serpin B